MGTVFTRQAAVVRSGTSGRRATSENGSSCHLRGGHLPGLLSTEQTAGGPEADKYSADLEDNSLPDIPEQAADLCECVRVRACMWLITKPQWNS